MSMMPDAGSTNPNQKPGNACACDTTFACDPDQSGGPCACDIECNCPCDRTFSCDPGCQACDPECLCECDRTFACDPGCEACDPECGQDSSSCACLRPGGGELDMRSVALIVFVGVGLVFRRRRRFTRSR